MSVSGAKRRGPESKTKQEVFTVFTGSPFENETRQARQTSSHQIFSGNPFDSNNISTDFRPASQLASESVFKGGPLLLGETFCAEKQSKAKRVFHDYEEFKTFLLAEIGEEKQQKMAALEQHLPSGEATKDWLLARLVQEIAKRVGGSSAGGIVNMNPYSNKQRQLLDFLWPSFRGNAATRYGNHHEPHAESHFENMQLARVLAGEESEDGLWRLVDTKVLNFGICCSRSEAWKGYSPDGVLEETWQLIADPLQKKTVRSLIEYKCPYKRRNTTVQEIRNELGDLYAMNRIRQPAAGLDELLPVPPQYFVQMMWGCVVMGKTFLRHQRPEDIPPCHFVVWCPAASPTDASSAASDASVVDENASSPCSSDEFDDDDVDTSTIFKEWEGPMGKSQYYSNSNGTMQVTRVPFDIAFGHWLEKEIKEWWTNQYLPLLYKKYTGELAPNEISCADALDIFV